MALQDKKHKKINKKSPRVVSNHEDSEGALLLGVQALITRSWGGVERDHVGCGFLLASPFCITLCLPIALSLSPGRRKTSSYSLQTRRGDAVANILYAFPMAGAGSLSLSLSRVSLTHSR